MNPGILIALGAVAVLAFAGKKKGKNGGAAKTDPTGTIPTTGPTDPPAAETQEQADAEAAFVTIAVDNVPMVFPLHDPGIDAGVIGIDADGFVHPIPAEWLSGWLTRVSFWGAYPYAEGHIMQLPPQCILEGTCPEEYIGYRNAMRRLNEEVKAQLINRGIPDGKFNPGSELFDA